jgi:hypothetical protein
LHSPEGGVHLPHADLAPGDVRLVGDDDRQIAGLVQQPDGRRRVDEQTKLVGMAVIAVAAERTVSIQEDRPPHTVSFPTRVIHSGPRQSPANTPHPGA